MMRQRLLAFVAVLVYCTLCLLKQQDALRRMISPYSVRLAKSSSSAHLQRPSMKTVPKLNWTTCPSENERLSQLLYKHFDAKLAQQLRVSAKSAPKMENESWHAVTAHIHVLSAFLVSTEYRAIHVISLVRDRLKGSTVSSHPPLVCHVRSSTETREYAARIKIVWTWLNPAFKNAFVLCQPPEEAITASGEAQVAIAIRGADTGSLRWLPLHIPSVKAYHKCCAVCVRPTFGSSVSLWKVAEFIAHYRLVGARSFYFYDLKMTPDLKLLIGTLQAVGIDITLVSFDLLLNLSRSDVHAQGQMPGLYDCIFRSMSKVEYFIHVDFDEFMFPLQHSSISAIVEGVERKHGKDTVGSIVVRSRYYCAEYPMNLFYLDNKHGPLQTVIFPYHSVDLPPHVLTFLKHIGRSRAICNAGVHIVTRHCGLASQVQINTSVAVINHYRQCCDFEKKHREKIPLWNVSKVFVDEPTERYILSIESELAIKVITRLATDV